MRKVALAVLAATVVGGSARPAFALLQFYKVFDEVYLAKNENKEYVELVRSKEAQCLVCHQGRNRKNRNAYGAQLDELLDKRKDIRDIPKIKEALAKVGEMHSDPEDEKSPTFDELIQQGELPGGKLEELKKEPEKKPQ
jgi:hypothetical protein